MPASSATNSAMPSLVPPEVQALFGDPPLMRGEDVGAYNKLLDQFAAELVEPRDVNGGGSATSPITHGKSGDCEASRSFSLSSDAIG